MLKGLSITPPVIGRISIGRVVENEAHREFRRRFCWSYAAIGIPAICS